MITTLPETSLRSAIVAAALSVALGSSALGCGTMPSYPIPHPTDNGTVTLFRWQGGYLTGDIPGDNPTSADGKGPTVGPGQQYCAVVEAGMRSQGVTMGVFGWVFAILATGSLAASSIVAALPAEADDDPLDTNVQTGLTIALPLGTGLLGASSIAFFARSSSANDAASEALYEEGEKSDAAAARCAAVLANWNGDRSQANKSYDPNPRPKYDPNPRNPKTVSPLSNRSDPQDADAATQDTSPAPPAPSVDAPTPIEAPPATNE